MSYAPQICNLQAFVTSRTCVFIKPLPPSPVWTLPPVESEQPGGQSITGYSFAHRHRLQPRGRRFNQTQSHQSC